MNIQNRTIYCKDNLDILKGIDSETVDMIYLDPPFNSKKQWNAPVGTNAEGASFKDTWTKDDIKEEWVDAIRAEYPELHAFLNSFKLWGQESDVAYIIYMAVRIIECRRILTSTGSLFYHCDHVMNDYVKIMLDIIFGRGNDVNNIVWCYETSGKGKSTLPKKHDNIFFYSKTDQYKFKMPMTEANSKNITSYNKVDEDGNRYYMRSGKYKVVYNPLKPRNDWWADDEVKPLTNNHSERTGYPTQKPLSLLRRIIEMTTDEGDIVLDPFCGCATTCVAAEQIGRRWVGIDVSIKAYELVKQRLHADVNNHGQLSLDSPEHIDINFSTTPPVRNAIQSAEKKWVYIISNEAYPDEYKVGIATNWKSRLNSYQTSDPNRGYKLEYKIETPNYMELEKAVHTYFDNRHEWVRAELNDIIDFIINHNE